MKLNTRGVTLLSCYLLLSAVSGAQESNEVSPATTNPNLVKNGSFENTKTTWMDTSCNYMELAAGASTIPHWTVTAATTGKIVWAMTPTCDGYTAASGTYFLDLTGFGSNAPNGGVQQTLANLSVGSTYVFAMDVYVQGSLPLVTVNNAPVSLTAGKPIKKGSTTWTPMQGTFTALSTTPVLVIENQQTGQAIDFIDNVTVRLQ